MSPGAKLFSYARNRTLDSKHGRWLQNDPNQSGQFVVSSLGHHGARPLPGEFSLNVRSRAAEGLNLYGYTDSNPIGRSDPTGLFFSLPGMLMTGLDALSNVNDQFDEAASGLRTAFGLSAMLDAYQFNQELTADLALDWNSSDDLLNRINTSGAASTFIAEAQTAGVEEFNRRDEEIAVAGVESHRVVPGLAGGTYDPLNVVDMSVADHQNFHRTMAQKFRQYGLNPPNAQGRENWRARFEVGDVTSSEKSRMRRAITDAALDFDGMTHNKYNLRERTRIAMKAPHISKNLRTIKKGFRGVRR